MQGISSKQKIDKLEKDLKNKSDECEKQSEELMKIDNIRETREKGITGAMNQYFSNEYRDNS